MATHLSHVAEAGLAISASYEDAFTEVSKTVRGLAEIDTEGFLVLTEAGQALADSLTEISDRIPATFEELSLLAGLGGQLGLAEGLSPEDAQRVLGSFAETIFGIGEATDLTKRRAGLDLAQITNIFKNSADSQIQDAQSIIDNIDNLGNTLVELGNTSETTEGRILSFATRISGSLQAIGSSQADMLGIAAGFTSIGLTAEAGGSAVIRTLVQMSKAAANSNEGFLDNTDAIEETIGKLTTLKGRLETLEYNLGVTADEVLGQKEAWLEAGNAAEDYGTQLGDTGRRQIHDTTVQIQELTEELNVLRATQGLMVNSENLQKFADVLGISAQEFKDLVKDDPTEALIQFVEGLGRAGSGASAILQDLSLGTVQTLRAFVNMASAGGLLREQVESSNAAWRDGIALLEEIAKRYATLSSRIQRFNNRMRNTVNIVFDDFLRGLGGIIDMLGEFSMLLRQAFVVSIKPEFARIFEPIGGFLEHLFTVPDDFDASKWFQDSVLKPFVEYLKTIDISGEIQFLKNIFDWSTGKPDFIGWILPISVQTSFSEFSKLITNIKDSLIKIKTAITAPIPTASLISVIDTGFKPIRTALEFINANWSTFEAGLIGAGAALVAAGTAAAIAGIALSITALVTPLNLLIVTGAALGVAWEKDWLGIQEATAKSVEAISAILQGEGLESLFTIFELDHQVRKDTLEFFDELQNLFELIEMPAKALKKSIEAVFDLLIALSGLTGTGAGDTHLDLSDSIVGLQLLLALPLLSFTADATLFSTSVQDLANMIGGFVDSVEEMKNKDTAVEFVDAFQTITDQDIDIERLSAIGRFFQTIKESEIPHNIAEPIGNFADALRLLNDVAIGPGIQNTLNFLGLLRGETKDAGGSAESILSQLKLFDGLADSLERFSLLESAISVFEWSTGIMKDIANIKIGSFVTNLGLLSSVMSELRDTLITTPLEDIEKFSSFWAIFKPEQVENFQAASEAFEKFKNTWQEITKAAAGDALKTALTVSSDIMQKFIEDAAEYDKQKDAFILWLQQGFADMLSEVSLGMPNFTEMWDSLVQVKQDITTLFTDMLKDVDFGWPTRDEVLEKFTDYRDIFFGFFTGFLSLEDTEDEGKDIADDVTAGFRGGIQEHGQEVAEDGKNFGERFYDGLKEFLGIESPSILMIQVAQSIIEGLSIGLKQHDALKEVLESITNLITETLIPVKLELVEVNLNELIPSIQEAERAEEELGDEIRTTTGRAKDQIDIFKKLRVEAEKVVPKINDMAKAYERLAKAIESVGSPNVPNPTATTATPEAQPAGEFASGGSFIVPDRIPPSFKGGSGGMLIEVHPGEFVQIENPATTNNILKQLRQVPASILSNLNNRPSAAAQTTSGARISNEINNSPDNSNTELHLHVKEVVSPTIQDSFNMMKSLAGI